MNERRESEKVRNGRRRRERKRERKGTNEESSGVGSEGVVGRVGGVEAAKMRGKEVVQQGEKKEGEKKSRREETRLFRSPSSSHVFSPPSNNSRADFSHHTDSRPLLPS